MCQLLCIQQLGVPLQAVQPTARILDFQCLQCTDPIVIFPLQSIPEETNLYPWGNHRLQIPEWYAVHYWTNTTSIQADRRGTVCRPLRERGRGRPEVKQSKMVTEEPSNRTCLYLITEQLSGWRRLGCHSTEQDVTVLWCLLRVHGPLLQTSQ